MPHIVDFRKPETGEELALFLGLSPSLLDEAIFAAECPDSSHIYIRHCIPKKDRRRDGYRIVWDVVDLDIRDAHRAFASRSASFAHDVDSRFPHSAAFGYVRGRGIKDNAAQHAGQRMLLRCDIENFFPSISRNRLTSHFIRLGIQESVAMILAGFTTIENKLALGLNASPALANLVCMELDTKIERLSGSHGCVYTRYADDITISGDTLPDYASVVDIVASEGFKTSRNKMRITKCGQAHFVTGLSVTDPAGPHVPREYKRRLRQEIYYCNKFGISGHLNRIEADPYQSGINRIDGTVRFVSSIETGLAAKLREQWRNILVANSAKVSYAPLYDSASAQTSLLFDEAGFEIDGKNCLALACVATAQIDKLRKASTLLLRDHLIDPFSPGRKKSLRQNGLHFADAPEDLRSEYVRILPYLSFRAYIAFGALRDDYSSLYASLLGSLLPRRLMGCDRSILTLIFEENPRVSPSTLRSLVEFSYSELEHSNNRRPLSSPQVLVCSKQEEPAFSVPDTLLAVFCRYFTATNAGDTSFLRFERVRDKYRHIVNIDTADDFSRRHPLEVKRDRRSE